MLPISRTAKIEASNHVEDGTCVAIVTVHSISGNWNVAVWSPNACRLIYAAWVHIASNSTRRHECVDLDN